MTEGLPKKQSNFVRDALASNPTLLSVYDGLEASGECWLKFCSSRNMQYRGMLQASISEQWGTRADRDVLPGNHAIGKSARQMEASDAARPFYRGSDHGRAA